MSLIRILSILTLSLLSLGSLADKEEDYADLYASVARVNPNLQVLSIDISPMFGVYKVVISTGDTLYMSADGEHFFTGTMYENRVDTPLVNLTERDLQDARIAAMQSDATKEAWVFEADGETKATITVFTDVDCFYCQKLHAEMPKLNALGVEVRYLAFPRAGINSSSHKVLADAWCAEDQNSFLTEAKQRAYDKLPPLASPAACDNPVADHFVLSQQLGLNGTPAIILDSGELWPGYLPAEEIAKRLGIN